MEEGFARVARDDTAKEGSLAAALPQAPPRARDNPEGGRQVDVLVDQLGANRFGLEVLEQVRWRSRREHRRDVK